MAFTDGGDDASVEVDVKLNLSEETITMMVQVLKRIFDQLETGAKSATAAGTKGFNTVGSTIREVTRDATKLEKAYEAALSHISQELIAVANATRDMGHALQVVNSTVRGSASLQRQEAIKTRQAEADVARARVEDVRAASKIEYAEIQNRGVAAKQAAQARLALQQNLFGQLTRMEKAFGAVVAGTAKTAVAAVSKSFDALGKTISRVFQRSGKAAQQFDREMNQGLSSSLRTRETTIRSSFNRQEQIISRSAARQQAQFAKIRTAASSGVAGAVSGRGIGPGIAAGAGGFGFAALLSAGFQRFSELERINKQFLALTGSVEDTTMLLEQAKAFAKTTPFDVLGVADLAKGFLAIGTAVEDVMPRVQVIADAVALTGGGVDSLERIQRAIGQVVSAGRLQGDELNQLAENLPGLNIRKILADQLTGGDTALLIEMQEAGEITSEMFVTGIIDGLASDKRLVGASQDLADTLGGRAANLKESWADFGAAVIGAVIVPLKTAILGLQTVLQSMADFIKGDVGPSLLVLRDGLFGAALGMTAVVAAKGAVEVFQLLGSSLKLALTPMGLLVTTIAILGAAIKILYDRSIPFQQAIDAIVAAVTPLGEYLLDKVAIAAEWVGNAFTSTVVPALEDAAVWLAEHVLPAARAVEKFITDKFIPAAIDLGKEVATLAVAIGQTLVAAFDWAADKAVAFWDTIEPYVRPLIDGFHSLANAIGAVFTDLDFSGVRGGFADLLSGILGTATNVKDRIAQVLTPIISGIQDFFREAFSGPNLKKYAMGFLGVIEEIGRILGLIVSDPMLYKVVAAVAAAAAVIALTFVKGFGTGIVENLPDLWGDLVWPALKAGLAALLDNIGTVLLIGVGAIGVKKLVASFRSTFMQAGVGAGQGFMSGFRSTISSTPGFLSGFMKGPSGVSGNASARFFKDITSEAQGLENQLRILGDPQRVLLDNRSMWEAKRHIADLRRGLTDAEYAGLQFRDRMKAAFSAVSTAAGGSGRAIRDGLSTAFMGTTRIAGGNLFKMLVGDQTVVASQAKKWAGVISTNFRAGFQAMKTGFSQTMMELRAIAQTQSTTLGRVIGGALVRGLAAGAAGFAIGQTSGGGAGGTLMALLGGGLTGAAVGGAPGAVVGTAAAGLGAAFAAFKRGSEEAKAAAAEFAGEVANLAQALITDLQNGLDAGVDGVLDLREALAGPSAVQALHDNVKSIVPTLLALGVEFDELVETFRDPDVQLQDIWDPTVWEGMSNSAQAALLEVINGAYAEYTAAIGVANDLIEFGTPAAYEAAQNAGVTAAETMIRMDEALGVSYDDVTVAVEETGKAIERSFDPQIIEDHLNRVGFIEDAYAEVREAIEKALAPLKPQDTQELVDSAVLAADEIIRGFGDAGLRQGLSGMVDDIAAVTNQGIADGLILTDNDLFAITAPILNALLAANTDPQIQEQLLATYSAALAELSPIIKTQAEKDADTLAAGLAEPKVTVTAAPTAQDEIRLAKEGQASSQAVVDGMVAGLVNGYGRIRSTAAGLAMQIPETVRNMLLIRSPSKVMMDIGGFIIEGLVEGVDNNTDDLREAATNAIDEYVSATVDAAEGAMSTFQQLGASLYGALIGPGASGISPFDFSQAAVAGQEALAGIADTLASNAEAIWNATAKAREGKDPLSRSESALLGKDSHSLDIADVIGRENRGALIDAFAAIGEYGDLMLRQGQTAQAVSDTLRPMIQHTIDYAAMLGFSRDQLIALADEIGMSDADIAAWVAAWEGAGAAAGAAGAAAMADEAQRAFEEAAEEIRKTISDTITDGLSGADFTNWTVGDLETIGKNAGLTGDALQKFQDDFVAQMNDLFFMDENTLRAYGRNLGLFGDGLAEWVKDVQEWQTPWDEEANAAAFQAEQDLAKAVSDAITDAIRGGEFMMDDIDVRTMGQYLGFSDEALDNFTASIDQFQEDLFDATEEQIEAVGRSFGLFGDALDQWVEEVMDWQHPEDAEVEPGEDPGVGSLPGNAPGSQTNYFDLYLPFGDPDAIALAVVNRLAMGV